MNSRVGDLSLEELKLFIDEAVDNRLEQRLGDPDAGLEVKPEFIERIKKSRRNKKNIPAEELAERLGLKW
jgi:hypothetical protein